jgi:uncharacterized damage-inducible protein DinB
MTSAAEFRRLFDYEQDAHRRTLASLDTAQPDHGQDADFRKAVDLAAHIATCRNMWLARLQGSGAVPPTLFPEGLALADVDRLFDETHRAWTAYLQALGDTEVDRGFQYVAYDGRRFADTVRNVLTQLFAHSSYHRGQIALLLRRIGAEPAVTDFVFWTRRPIDG